MVTGEAETCRTYGFSVAGGLRGLSFSAGTRVLSGAPTVAGRYVAAYTVTDGSGASDSLSFTITVTDVTGVLDVRSDPAGASVYLNDGNTGQTTPATFDLPTGRYGVVLVLEGFVPESEEFEVRAKRRASVSLIFETGARYDDDDEDDDVPEAPGDPPSRGVRGLHPASLMIAWIGPNQAARDQAKEYKVGNRSGRSLHNNCKYIRSRTEVMKK